MIAPHEITEPWTDNLPSEESPLTVEEAILIAEGVHGCRMADLTGDDLSAFVEIALTIWKRSHHESDTTAFVQAAGELAMLAMCVQRGKIAVADAPGILFMDELRPHDGECIIPRQQLVIFDLLAHGPPLLDPLRHAVNLEIDAEVTACLDKIGMARPRFEEPPRLDGSNRHERRSFRASQRMRPHRRRHGRRR